MNKDSKKNLYIWQIDVITNLGNKKQIILSWKGLSLDSVRTSVISYILKISRYGIPCYQFKSNSGFNNNVKKNGFILLNDINSFTEYYEITSNFIDIINTSIQHINFNNNDKLELNINAEPFIPLSTIVY